MEAYSQISNSYCANQRNSMLLGFAWQPQDSLLHKKSRGYKRRARRTLGQTCHHDNWRASKGAGTPERFAWASVSGVLVGKDDVRRIAEACWAHGTEKKTPRGVRKNCTWRNWTWGIVAPGDRQIRWKFRAFEGGSRGHGGKFEDLQEQSWVGEVNGFCVYRI